MKTGLWSKWVLLATCVLLLSGCGSIISRTVGKGHGYQYYPGVQWDLRDSPWRYVTALDVPFSLIADTFMLPFDAKHGPYN
ncbi:YceK/YidQ family lipoprotein [Obesumbacterium proteus]|uniref:YceK/YidQ family lipoprotein n=1 Tax=Obesumbacterium proteus TaxID=82983 RepID=UPI001F234E39|nr:YceK/YidQ family lipoprotein [Obesumbacterium proteus]MCE9885009.1 YceK/YidQ family lipoprotein [Obesumbacterium proteus]MCE9917954.1 YceK/YidQ family lipoprotein [Obesumbacterium proteus]MCE9931148.1 YceK/YidQ family lipoprotein [Obesumbacterium proteus]MCG2877310.1 YceK/YidQ family lipoprotein [Obesumbacterium proteus]